MTANESPTPSPKVSNEGYMTGKADVDRAFVRIEEGLVHYRHAGLTNKDKTTPVYMVHAGPGSSAGLAPLIQELGASRPVIAPDTLGNGDSAPPAVCDPDLQYYAESIVRVCDALDLDQIDYFGSHTGAHIGIELLISYPDRVRHAVFDGLALFDPDMRQSMLENYAPEVHPQEFGEHLIWAWHFVRDQSIHFPYYLRTPDYRMHNALPPADMIQPWVVDVLKALGTYHMGYRAVFSQDTVARLRNLPTTPLMVMCSEFDPLHIYLDQVAGVVPHAEKRLLTRDEGLNERAAALARFFDTSP